MIKVLPNIKTLKHFGTFTNSHACPCIVLPLPLFLLPPLNCCSFTIRILPCFISPPPPFLQPPAFVLLTAKNQPQDLLEPPRLVMGLAIRGRHYDVFSEPGGAYDGSWTPIEEHMAEKSSLNGCWFCQDQAFQCQFD